MRYLSVCSGIEAASVAWHHLGWEPVGFSEIESFPAAVLKHRFPHVPNYGDMTKFEEWPIEPGTVDLLVGGTPCQSFSVAGLRKGLEDPRGNLMLTYLAIAARLQPRWIVWENVPGVLSSNGGRDFGTFLGALGELRYGWAYRVLDAQYVRVGRWPRAVPQRRRRVFVVGCLADGTAAAEVLALEEGLRRHIEAQSKKGKNTASDAEGGARGGCWWDGGQVSQTLDAVLSKGQTMPEKNRFPAVLQPTEVSGTIAARFGQSRNNHEECVVQPTAGTLGNRGLRSHTELDGHGAYIPVAFSQNQREEVREVEVPGALAAEPGTHQQTYIAQPVPFTKSKRAQSVTDDETWVDGQVNPTLSLFDQGDTRATTVAVAQAMTVRRLSPRECERLQGFPDDWTLIPWRKKQAEDCPDGPRYKALGNSMAVNCMAWIGERIAAYEDRHER
jgi:DNA (cytosine-5)-methyltransferase 1